MRLWKNNAGFDCGYRNGGLVVFSPEGEPQAYALFRSKKTKTRYVWQEQFSVCLSMALWLKETCRKYSVGHVAVEYPTGASRNQRAVKAMSLAFGTTTAALACCNIQISPVMPDETKRLIGAKGKAPVIDWALEDDRLLQLFPAAACRREHLADAAAAAYLKGLYVR